MKKIKEYFIIIKQLWSNKKTRAWIGLGFYFIFFLILAVLMRISPGSKEPATSTEYTKTSDIKTIISNLEDLSRKDYNYKIVIADIEVIGTVVNGTNSFDYLGNNYIFVCDKIYKRVDSNLELVDNLLNTGIPINLITIDKILNCLQNLDYRYDSYINSNFEVIYDVQSSKMASDLLDTMTVKLYGKDNVTNKIVISYQNNDYVLNIY